MLSYIVNNKIQTAVAAIVAVLIISIVFLVVKNNRLADEIARIGIVSKVTEQNLQDKIDSLNQVPDSVQIYRLFVRKIVAENQATAKLLDEKIVLLETELKFIKRDTVFVDTIVYRDLDSNIVSVPFNGRFAKVSVNGHTDYDRTTKIKSFELSIVRDPFELSAFTYYNPNDSSVNNSITVDGERFTAKSVIDPELHRLVIAGLPRPHSFFDDLYAGIFVVYDRDDRFDTGLTINYRYRNFVLSGNASFDDRSLRLDYIRNFNDWIKP